MPKKQYGRLSREVAERVRKLLADAKPTLQAKYGITGVPLDAAITNGVLNAALEVASSISTEARAVDRFPLPEEGE